MDEEDATEYGRKDVSGDPHGCLKITQVIYSDMECLTGFLT